MGLPAPPRPPGTIGRPRKHGGDLALSDPATWPAPQVTTSTVTSRYGMAVAQAWDRVHPRLDRKSTRLNSSHANISYAVFCLKKKKSNYLQGAVQIIQNSERTKKY